MALVTSLQILTLKTVSSTLRTLLTYI